MNARTPPDWVSGTSGTDCKTTGQWQGGGCGLTDITEVSTGISVGLGKQGGTAEPKSEEGWKCLAVIFYLSNLYMLLVFHGPDYVKYGASPGISCDPVY